MSRRAIVMDTLSDALDKDRCSMQCTMGSIEGSRILTSEERGIAVSVMQQLEDVERRLLDIYANVPDRKKASLLRVHARTLLEEISVLRESAFWLMDKDKILTMEAIISQQISAYDSVRQLLRYLAAKDVVQMMPADVESLPEIPSNRYLKFALPEAFA